MERILVIGAPGAGKSTFSEKLSSLLCLPFFHLDSICLDESGSPLPNGMIEASIMEILVKPRFIMDGNYPGTLRKRLQFADAAFFSSTPRWRSAGRPYMRG